MTEDYPDIARPPPISFRQSIASMLPQSWQPHVLEKDVDKLVQQLEEIRNQFGRTGTNGQALVDVVKKRANSLRTSIATSRANIQSELAALERLKSVDSLPALQLALTDFVTSAPKSLMAVEVQKVISETPIWQRIEDWNGVTLQATDYLNSKAPEKAAALTKSLNDINSKLKSNPALAELEAVRSHLDKVSRRKEILTELSNKLSRDIRIGLYTLVGTSRKSDPKQRYFAYSSTVDPLMERIKSGSVGLEVVTGSDGTVNREGFTGQITISKEPQKTFAFLAAQFKDNSAAVLRNWESEMLIRIGEVMKNAELDAAIKEMLIARILESACQGSNLLQDLQTNNLTMLQTRVSSNRTWHQATAPKVELDAEVMKQLRPSLSDTLAVVKKGQADILLEQISKKNMRFIGYVLKSDEGTPSARIVEAGDVSGFLIVLSGVDMNNTIASMAEVGKIRNGKVQLSGSASQLAAGRPLFLMPAVSTK